MIARGETGGLSFVHGHYLQDWMTDPNVYSWRSDPAKGGVSSALGDIGSHWCDLAEHVSGIEDRLGAGRSHDRHPDSLLLRRFGRGVFERAALASDTPVQVESEDLASVLLRFENGAKGCFSVGQVLPGHKNDLQLEVNGRACSLEVEAGGTE